MAVFSFNMGRHYLAAQVDNTPLVLFRIVFGFLVFMEGVSFFFLGHVSEIYTSSPLTFTYYGLEWVQPLPGVGMHVIFILICLAGLMMMAGWKYRPSAWAFAIMWTYIYYSHKVHYNNHHYLLMLVAYAMALMPAAANLSVDAHLNSEKRHTTCPRWCLHFFIFQLLIVYTCASLAKLYPDWLNATPIRLWMAGKANYWLVGGLLQYKWVHYLLAYGGIVFDATIVWLLLWKRTRWVGVAFSFVFHLFNSLVFHIGIFPYLILGTLFFFFEGEGIRGWVLKKWKWGVGRPAPFRPMPLPGFVVLLGYLTIQILLPLRHLLFEGNVHWTEEGHKLSWHMMLRIKSGTALYKVVNQTTGEVETVNAVSYLGQEKGHIASIQPDVIRQFARHLKKQYMAKGWDNVAVFVDCQVSLNGHPRQPLIDPTVDMAAVPWEPFRHSDYILQWNDVSGGN